MKKILITSSLISLSLASCSSGENYQTKMGRYQARDKEKFVVPDLTVSGFTFTKDSKRSPASEVKSEKSPEEMKEESNFTNKKLYFLSLVDQYETLKSYSDSFNAPKISMCPNFHTGLITHYEKASGDMPKQNSKFNYDLAKIDDPNYLSLHPEFYLPLTSESKTPKVVDIIKSKKIDSNVEVNELVKKALNLHLQKTYRELAELCEFGSSDNYYIYENLITHVKSSAFPASNENMGVLLKTTVFSNMAIINSFEGQKSKGRTIASEGKVATSYSKDIIKKMNVEWSYDYFKKLKN